MFQLGIFQGINQTNLYLWYSLFQAQMGYMRSTKSPNLELFSYRTSSSGAGTAYPS